MTILGSDKMQGYGQGYGQAAGQGYGQQQQGAQQGYGAAQQQVAMLGCGVVSEGIMTCYAGRGVWRVPGLVVCRMASQSGCTSVIPLCEGCLVGDLVGHLRAAQSRPWPKPQRGIQ